MPLEANKYYFISDVHLGFYEREIDKMREDKFLQCLDLIASDAKAIYLIGDIFDYWFEWKTVIPRYYYRTLAKLYDLKHSGIEIYYLMGNHDFGHFDFFEKELGIKVHPNELVQVLEGNKFYLHHGDGVGKGDNGYKMLKRITRNELNKKLFTRLLHPNFAIKLASTSSSKSRKYTDKKYGNKLITAKELLDACLVDGDYDYVVIGHLHQKVLQSYGKGIYVNLDTWLHEPNIGVFDGEKFYFKEDL